MCVCVCMLLHGEAELRCSREGAHTQHRSAQYSANPEKRHKEQITHRDREEVNAISMEKLKVRLEQALSTVI